MTAGTGGPTGSQLPSARYAIGAVAGDWRDDPAQHQVLRELDRMHSTLSRDTGGGLLARLTGRNAGAAPPGLYLWGGVGRGKTFLIDLFFDGLPLAEKRRTHFHRFMREIHAQLRSHAGERDPLVPIVRAWRKQWRVLVLDEFLVSDIGDAMLLARLLERMFAEGIVLVTSSNTPPVNLYRHGLQRERFLPAIALIQRHCHVLKLDSAHDYRLRALTRSPVYRAPLDSEADAWLLARWEELAAGTPAEEGPLRIEGREIPVRALAEGHVWFDFADLCEGPRAASDYIEIATEYHTVLLGGIPHFDGNNDDAARRFITAIDEFHDRHVNLVCTAAADPPGLYTGQRLTDGFSRTASRLIQMQTADYLALEHRA